MRDLPTGTVTFLFTDIEGSTRLLHELGDGYADALAEHRRLLREAFSAHGGAEVDTQGDAFFYAFARGKDAVAAAAKAQEALAEGPVRVRIGLHTGEPIVTDEGYVGMDVHKGARIAAAGHGGQVLLSQTTRELVEAELRDLGEHRLKDLSAPERLFQLGAADFPPLKTLYRTNLPVPATPFLGRERELREVSELLAREDVRLLTLTGPGGTGKTRLALQAAAERSDDYPDGVFWVALAPLRDAALVLDSAAQALGGKGALAEQVGDRRLLILLDNFEHLVAASTGLAELLRACPRLDLLVTSRELLQIAAEQAYPVPALADPEAVELFLARARAAQPAFAGGARIPELCARLDNLPLALELAAARTRVFTPDELFERLSRRLDFLKAGRDADPRQQTLRATIEWSYDLLDDAERSLFARLAAFSGGCTLEAAEQVCEADSETLVSLADKSLVRRRDDGRFWMLETIGELAAERLEASGEEERMRRRHADYFSELAAELGLAIESMMDGHPQRYDLALPEQDNLRAALDWALVADPVAGLRLAGALENFWVTQSPSEGASRLPVLLERAADAPLDVRARGIRALGSVTIRGGDPELGARRYAQSLELFERAGDERSVAVMEHRLGASASQLGDWERARAAFEHALARARELRSRHLEAQALGSLAGVEHHEENMEGALALARESGAMAREIGFIWWEMNMLELAADSALALGRADDAQREACAALALGHGINDRLHTVYALAFLARIATERGDPERAGRLWGALEAEEARGPLASWERDREEHATPVLAHAGAEFDAGRAEGRRLSRHEAVEYALACTDGSPSA